jgi:sodium/potassium-transporting ATPase subunit alpha
MVNVFVCRHPLVPAWRFSLTENPLLVAGLLLEGILLLAIVYTPWGNAIFGTAPLAIDVWIYLIPFALFLGVAEEARKWWLRRELTRQADMLA